MIDVTLLNGWATELAAAAKLAGAAIMELRRGDLAVSEKADRSPVTAADAAAEEIILTAVDRLAAGFPVVAEERMAREGPPKISGDAFWLVDALDGTKEFIRGGDAFTVNVGLIYRKTPILGVVHAPASRETYVGIVGAGARAELADSWQSIETRPRPRRVTILGSRSHEIKPEFERFIRDYPDAETIAVGSSIKFCMIAAGRADLYPRFGPTSEWDTAAGDAIVRAAGGRVHSFDGEPLGYGKPEFRNGRFLVEGSS